MYCVIQEIDKRKKSEPRISKELVVDALYCNNEFYKFTYEYSFEKFERPISKSYRVSIRQSKRVKGVVTQKQFHVTTIDYYNLVDDYMFGWNDYVIEHEDRLKKISISLDVALDDILEVIAEKIEPLIEKLKVEYELTEEYKTSILHSAIIAQHLESQRDFDKIYGSGAYDKCYDVFGTLKRPENLKFFKDKREKTRKENEEFFKNYKSRNTYSSDDYKRAYQEPNKSGLDKSTLKKFYKVLAVKFHPDHGGDVELMKKVNELKEEWGI